jgi:hypothetical protein
VGPGEVEEVPASVSARTRRAVHLFLLLFALTGLAHLEVFPFSGFRLFSELRSDQRVSWQLRAVDAAGEESPIRLSDLPVGYRNSTKLLPGFADLPAGERDAICDAWAGPARASGQEVTEVRVYQVVQGVHPDAPPPERRLAHTCGASP